MTVKTITYNRRASFDYNLLEKYEAGLVLQGHEVKSIKNNRISLAGSFVVIKRTPKLDAYLINAHIPAYQPKNAPPNYDETRSRKLLLRKNEINTLVGKISQKGLTLVPIRVYLKRGLVKLEFAVGKGKRKIDKREIIKKRETEREMRRITSHNS